MEVHCVIVTYYMWYMYNRWCQSEAVYLFGENLGKHIWKKYVYLRNTTENFFLELYAHMDEECKQKLVERAIEIYR